MDEELKMQFKALEKEEDSSFVRDSESEISVHLPKEETYYGETFNEISKIGY